MNETILFEDERIDDLPVLWSQLERMQVRELLDKHLPTHGNWQGLSLGQVAQVWLCFILSEANHRLSHVQPWVEQRLQSLRALVSPDLRALDFSDDRLAAALDYLSEEAGWRAFEAAVSQHTIRVYELNPARVRLDSTTASGYRSVVEGGVFQFGHSKDHRPDLPQVKVNLAALDPLGWPLTTTVVAGQTADDPLYVPEIARVQQVLDRHGVTYVGDVKMSALATRAFIAAHGDYYLCPLSAVPVPPATLDELLAPVCTAQQSLTALTGETASPAPGDPLAEGFEVPLTRVAATADGPQTWPERRLLIRSRAAADRARHALHERLDQAIAAIQALGQRGRGKPRLTEPAPAQAQVAKILARYQVEGLLEIDLRCERHARPVRGYAGSSARVQVEQRLSLEATPKADALAAAERRLGWRVYATNAPAALLALETALQVYRQAHRIENDFARLKGKPLSLTPIYLQAAHRVTGLIRLLTLGVRVLTLVEFVVRRALAQPTEPPLQGLYPGNPKRSTTRPTTELLLRAFSAVTLAIMTQGEQRFVQIKPLSALQHRILHLLGLPTNPFDDLIQRISDTSFKMSEP